MPMAIIALVMTKAHRADKNTKRQPMMKIAAWAGRDGQVLGALFPPNGRYAFFVVLTATLDLFICANDLSVSQIGLRSTSGQPF